MDLWLDNLELIWIMGALIILWARCKHGIMQSGAIGIIRATRHARGASKVSKKIEAFLLAPPHIRNMRWGPDPLS